jgi:malonate-semialdehyde dehydrogenase (acetylating)/methylmalonate-semialdehyde dehydrogenase
MKTMIPTVAHHIGGESTSGASHRTAPVWNPATGERQADVLLAESSDVDLAVSAAREAFSSWQQS